MKDNFLWVEKYRPKLLDDIILPDNLKKVFISLKDKGEMMNLLLSGSAGTGKTTVARALCEELGCDYIIINGSDEGRSIDILRDKIKKFVSTVSTTTKPKVVIIDEADYLGLAVQPALRNFIEEFSGNARFILTCNYKHKIIPPLHSRCSVIDFSITKKDLPAIAGAVAKKCLSILNQEGIKADQKAVLEVVKQYFPDNRRIINELQRYSNISGEIDSGIISLVNTTKVKTLIKFIKQKDFKSCRQWIADNPDPDSLFEDFYRNINEYVEASSIPNLILIIGEYQHRAAFVTSQEINLAAFVVEVMKNVKFS
jgi:DNA polymerase III delta prime subunit|tara:strand:+ start:6641 stop:7576 length:936 start_codon:yes stop_codon:yes gene_type:complete